MNATSAPYFGPREIDDLCIREVAHGVEFYQQVGLLIKGSCTNDVRALFFLFLADSPAACTRSAT